MATFNSPSNNNSHGKHTDNLTKSSTIQAQQEQQHAQNHFHFKMYKPYSCLTQFVYTPGGTKQRKRKKVKLLGDIYDGFPPRTMAIGRLDQDSEGLLLLTTDGRISNQIRQQGQTNSCSCHNQEEEISSPTTSSKATSTVVEKEYWAQVKGTITEEAIAHLQKGVEIIIQTSSSKEDRIQNTEGRRTTVKSAYTTLPCKVHIFEAQEILEKYEQQQCKQTTSGSTTTDGKQPQKKKRKNIVCNTCLVMGHRAGECPTSHRAHSTTNPTKNTTSPKATIHRIPRGIPLPGRIVLDESCHGPTSWVSITVTEGKFRQIRKMTSAVGFPTLRLVRVRIGSISLDGMDVGEVRPVDIEYGGC
jgi:pseudouridine synthase